MVFTGFKLLRQNLREVNFPMLTGIGLPNKRNGCCLRQMLPRLIGGSRYFLREWKYQVARLGDKWWINKVDTYGMASAQIYWGRMAALLLRLVYHTFPLADWGFVFVDDFCWLLRKTLAEPLTTAILLFLVAVGCPLSWKKTAIGSSNTWLSFMVTPSQQLVRMAPTKHDLVMSVLSKMMANEEFTRPELDSALGRLQWATTCCPLTKPFLQAFWQWRIAVKSSNRPSKLLRNLPNCSTTCSTRTSDILPSLLPRAHGGGRVMLVPQMMDQPLWEAGSAIYLHHRNTSFLVPLQSRGALTPLGFQGQEAQKEDCSIGDVWHLAPHYVSLSTQLNLQWLCTTSLG